MIDRLLPPSTGAVVVDALTDPPEARLFPEEERLLGQAVEKRRLEFTTVRHCAREALARLGLPPAPILPGDYGAPRWPEGVVGSMTHCAGYRAAVIAREADLVTVGVDAEPHDALPPEVLDTVTLPEERDQLARLAARSPQVHWDRLLFSAKESVYKAWFPLTRLWLDFDQAVITFEPDPCPDPGPVTDPMPAPGAFRARLLVPGPFVAGARLPGFRGRWLVSDGLLFTAIAVNTDGSDATAGASAAGSAAGSMPDRAEGSLERAQDSAERTIVR